MPGWHASEYWLHPVGEFEAQLVNWESVTYDYQGKQEEGIKWTFETDVHREDGKAPQLSRRTSWTLSPKSIAGEIVLALGFDIPAREEIPNFDTDALIGSRCIIDVQHNKLNDGSVWANIVAFRPLRKKATGATGFQAGANARDRAPQPATASEEAAKAGCPDPSYDHSLKPGKPGYDPFHSESCPLMQQDEKAA